MPLQKSFIKIEGSLDELSFYRVGSKYYIRRKGGFTAERIASDPAYRRTRENASEFTYCSKAGKVFRQAFAAFSKKTMDRDINQRTMKVMFAIKNLDETSARGARSVAVAMERDNAKTLLKGFDFNSSAPLSSILTKKIDLDSSSGSLIIPDFNPERDLKSASEATHVSFQSAWTRIDFANYSFDSKYSQVVNLALQDEQTSIQLTPSGSPEGSGVDFYAVLIEFFQEVNGVQYALENEGFGVMHLLEVG